MVRTNVYIHEVYVDECDIHLDSRIFHWLQQKTATLSYVELFPDPSMEQVHNSVLHIHDRGAANIPQDIYKSCSQVHKNLSRR